MLVSVDLATRLREAGLRWRPARFDFFHIPDRNLDDETFVIADLSIEVQRLTEGIAAITFNGAVEWSLDFIFTEEVVWLPTEAQARDLLGGVLVSLDLREGTFTCTVSWREGERRYRAPAAADAYALAVLDRLEHRLELSGLGAHSLP